MKKEEIDTTTEMDTEYDIVDEMIITLEEMEKKLQDSENVSVLEENLPYMKFLLKELDDTLSGEYDGLRWKRFIVKKTP